MEKQEIQKFNCAGSTAEVATRWTKWVRAFELYVEAKGITETKRKKAMLLHCAGLDVQDIYFTLEEQQDPSQDDTDDEYKKSLDILTKHFTPQVNTLYERHVFRNMQQNDNETVAQFVVRLKLQASYCNYGGQQMEHIRDQVVEKCKSSEMRRKFLGKGNTLTLENVLEISRIFEASNEQANIIENKHQQVNRIKEKCYRCGSVDHKSYDKTCPARNQVCHKCNITGHFKKQCRTKAGNRKEGGDQKNSKQKGKRSKVRQVTDETDEKPDDDDDRYAFKLDINSLCKPDIDIYVKVGEVRLGVLIDSGSTCNVIDSNTWSYLKENRVKCTSQKTTAFLKPYGTDNSIKVKGKFTAMVETESGKSVQAEFHVIEGKGISLLSKQTAISLGILKLGKV